MRTWALLSIVMTTLLAAPVAAACDCAGTRPCQTTALATLPIEATDRGTFGVRSAVAAAPVADERTVAWVYAAAALLLAVTTLAILRRRAVRPAVVIAR